jgi:hypothetical protein
MRNRGAVRVTSSVETFQNDKSMDREKEGDSFFCSVNVPEK